jgi:hypothetical protein
MSGVLPMLSPWVISSGETERTADSFAGLQAKRHVSVPMSTAAESRGNFAEWGARRAVMENEGFIG